MIFSFNTYYQRFLSFVGGVDITLPKILLMKTKETLLRSVFLNHT